MVWGRGIKGRLKPLKNTPGVYSFFQEIFAPLENLYGQKIVNKIFHHHSIKKLIVNKIFHHFNKIFLFPTKKAPFYRCSLMIFTQNSSFLSIFSLKFTQIYLKFVNFYSILLNFIQIYSILFKFYHFLMFFNVFNH